jgi:pyruvate,water dikinase
MSDQLRQPEFDPAAQDLPRAWRAAWTGFIARHGHRGLAEMEASAVTWRYDPAPAVAVIRSYLDLPESRSPEATLKRQERERVELTTEVAAKMWQPKRLFFRRALSGAQENVALRERTKSLAVRAIRLVDIYRETIQERLVSRGFIASADDMYFLANSEITQVLLGTAPGPFQDRVIRRRKEYERNRHVRLGSVTGRAHVILDPTVDSPLQPGEILVAPVTDAGWTPLFAIASGLVVDMGSALSHGSTVAREYGLPAVVNVRNATRIIKTGDLIAVNGTRGTVTIMEPAGG